MTETFNPNQWTYHYIINDRTRTIEVPAGMKKAKIKITRKNNSWKQKI